MCLFIFTVPSPHPTPNPITRTFCRTPGDVPRSPHAVSRDLFNSRNTVCTAVYRCVHKCKSIQGEPPRFPVFSVSRCSAASIRTRTVTRKTAWAYPVCTHKYVLIARAQTQILSCLTHCVPPMRLRPETTANDTNGSDVRRR